MKLLPYMMTALVLWQLSRIMSCSEQTYVTLCSFGPLQQTVFQRAWSQTGEEWSNGCQQTSGSWSQHCICVSFILMSSEKWWPCFKVLGTAGQNLYKSFMYTHIFPVFTVNKLKTTTINTFLLKSIYVCKERESTINSHMKAKSVGGD